jgi:transposase-like protein
VGNRAQAILPTRLTETTRGCPPCGCWTDFLRKLRGRGLRGVKLVISDAHEGSKAAVAKILEATWQRCRVRGRYMTLETIAPLSDDPIVGLPAVAT